MYLRRPDPAAIHTCLTRPSIAFSYPDTGLSARLAEEPELLDTGRYDFDSHVFRLGTGEARFAQATNALRRWAHFEVPWLSFEKNEPELHPNQVVATLVSVLGVWFLNPCRVVYIEDGENHFAFAYGTLEGHAESGEERFEISIDPESGAVVYRLEAFSRPALLASRLAYPLARRLQARFAKASGAALQAAIAD